MTPHTAIPDDVRVREATRDDLTSLLGVLDAAALETDYDRVRASVDRGETLVAVRVGPDEPLGGDDACETTDAGDGPVLGALVLDGDEIVSVAVRRRRRGQRIGTALVESAADRRDRLVAAFDGDVRPFYERLGFEVEPLGDGDRYRGVRETG